MEMNRAEGGEPIMLHIAICDDQADQIQKIREASEKYFQNRKEHVDYQTFENAFAFIEAVDKGDFFDIVLLDVCMPGILGTDVARELRDHHSRAEIIFLTTSDEFAVEAFEVKATDYLLKPFTQAQFSKAMDRAIAYIRQRNSAKVIFRLVGGGVRVEEIAQILFLESHGHVLEVYLADGSTLETRKSGQEMKTDLDKIASGPVRISQQRLPGEPFRHPHDQNRLRGDPGPPDSPGQAEIPGFPGTVFPVHVCTEIKGCCTGNSPFNLPLLSPADPAGGR